MSIYQIGPFRFITIDGPPDPPSQQLELIARTGVAGVAALKTGEQGVPWRVITRVDVDTIDDADELLALYKAQKNQDPVELIWASFAKGKVIILDVRALDLREIPGGTGGLSTSAGGWLVAEWDLVLLNPTMQVAV